MSLSRHSASAGSPMAPVPFPPKADLLRVRRGHSHSLKTADDHAPRLLYDRKEAARQLSISVRSVDYYLAQRKFDTRRIGKKVLITHASLVRFAQQNHYEGVLAPPKESGPASDSGTTAP